MTGKTASIAGPHATGVGWDGPRGHDYAAITATVEAAARRPAGHGMAEVGHLARRPLGQLEAEVLAALAGADTPIATAEIQARIPGEPAYTTINTILFRLHAKHLVTRERAGRHYLYRLAVDESRLVADRMHGHLRHASDPSSVLSRFVQNLTADEEQVLRDILDQAQLDAGEGP